ncbi:MAG: hypothetical protein ACRDCE_06095 [Cetobacterium sp.]|uniref:hypothetical protein n=1 Tax=Cetobacterium sp. TaxID=2071632 RepID=UPI003EE75568
MEKLKYVTESNYKFKLDGGIMDWFLLSLAWLVVSIITFGIGMPFMTIYVIKTFIGSIEVDKKEKTYEVIKDDVE